MKKFIKLKINNLLKYWNYLNFLRINGILIFCQNLSLSAKKDLDMYNYLNNYNYKWKILNKNISKKFLDKKFFIKIKNFNNILILNDLIELNKIEIFLKKKNILVLGYYIKNIFFYKKDFDLKKIEKKNILSNINKRIKMFFINKFKIFFNIKKLLIKIIFLLKKIEKKNGYN